jgi:hypothetical protein
MLGSLPDQASRQRRLETHPVRVRAGGRWGAGRLSSGLRAIVNLRPDGFVVIEQPDGTRAVHRRE